MAIEAKRGCGFRKVGGIYLVAGTPGLSCDRLPHVLGVCPTCNAGIKHSRGWTWVDVSGLFGGPHAGCKDSRLVPGSFALVQCPLCEKPTSLGRAGLIWVGEKYYRSPEEFLAEASTLGISRRIAAVPRGFKVGETWVLLAHPKAVMRFKAPDGRLLTGNEMIQERKILQKEGETEEFPLVMVPAIFSAFRPDRIEKIVTQSQSQDAEFMADLHKKGMTPVVVPDDDRDHNQGVDEEEQTELFEDVVLPPRVSSESGQAQRI